LATSIFFISSTTTSQARRGLPDRRDGFFAGRATGAENLDFALRRHAESSEPITLSWAVARGQVGRPVETVHPGGHSKVKSPVHPMLEDPRSSLSSRHWRSR